MAIGFAFVRYDLWGSRALLSRLLSKLVVGAVACALAVLGGIVVTHQLGVPFRWAVLSATTTGILVALLVTAALTMVEQAMFPSRARYKPTVDQLSEELTSLASPDAVARSIERTVRRWLPCDHVRVALRDAGDPGSRPGTLPGVEIAIPVRFGSDELGELEVGAKAGNALFTTDDVDLLKTIANQGALALAHARAYEELERRRRRQAAAWQGERAAIVETVASELAHEIRHPLNFFRTLLRQGSRRDLDAVDVEIGREEVERLERLVAGLRRVAKPRLQRGAIAVLDLYLRTEALLRDEIGGRSIEIDGDLEIAIRCDVDQATQMLVNLLANALQATDSTQRVGLEWCRSAGGVSLTVWDEGPGFVGDPAALFAPWVTTKEGGTGLGLAITHRLVGAHNWTVQAVRTDRRTRFTINVRAEDVVQSSGAPTAHCTIEVA
jgi:signal transduction histidine kinase